MRKNSWILIALLLALALLFVGYRWKQSAGESGATKGSATWAGFAGSTAPVMVGHPLKPSELTNSELQFGVAPKRGPGVTYQDGIILMEHGDKAIRSFASDGLSWTFDANAPQIADFEVGKTIFATGRCVGKILALQRNGDKVSVILGPAQLPELIKEGNFAYDQPLDLNSLTAVATPDSPGALNSDALNNQASRSSSLVAPPRFHRRVEYFTVSSTGKWMPMRTVRRARAPRLRDASFHPGAGSLEAMGLQSVPSFPSSAPTSPLPPGSLPTPPGLGNPPFAPPVTPKLPQLQFNGLQAYPCATDCGGIGLKLYQEKDGVKVWISVIFHLIHPHIQFNASISRSGNVNANVMFDGGAGVTVSFDAAAEKEFKGNIHEIGLIPLEINVPIGGFLVPLNVKLSQSLDLESAFSAKTSTLHGEGDVSLEGRIAAGIIDNHWSIDRPTATLKQNLAGMVSGVSVGINSLVLGVDQRLMVGVGVQLLSVGPYVDLYTSFTATDQSSIVLRPCTQGTLNMQLGAGIGYSMPKVVASVINAILSLFGAKPIPATGSLVNLPKRVVLIDHKDQIPSGCAGN
jgi:hypothetical protein